MSDKDTELGRVTRELAEAEKKLEADEQQAHLLGGWLEKFGQALQRQRLYSSDQRLEETLAGCADWLDRAKIAALVGAITRGRARIRKLADEKARLLG